MLEQAKNSAFLHFQLYHHSKHIVNSVHAGNHAIQETIISEVLKITS